MKTVQSKKTTWQVSYDPYIDIVQVFLGVVFHMPDNKINSKIKGDAKLLYDKRTRKPLLLELNKAYEHLGEIDKLDTNDIMRGIIKYVNHYG